MIKNNKGFVVTEVLILSTVIIGLLVFMFIQFKNINRSYQYSFKYDTVSGMYLANNIVNYINENFYFDGDNNYYIFDKLVNDLKNSGSNYVDISDCSFDLNTYCSYLMDDSNIDKILFTYEDVSRINTSDFDEDLKSYIKNIQTNHDVNDYRIIVKYKDNTFASMRFNKGDKYVQSGLIAYLDGINNTGYGHSNDTGIWVDLSGNGNDATLYNNPTWSNNSLTFDGLTNYGLLNNTAGMTYENGTTWEVRVKVLSYIGKNGSGNVEFLGNWQDAGGGIYYDTTNIFRGNFYLSGGFRGAINNLQSDLGTYYTITSTYDNSVVKIYVNGNLAATREVTDNSIILSSSVPFALGGNPGTTRMDNYANVEFQNVLIYNRALTDEEVARNYNVDMMKY